MIEIGKFYNLTVKKLTSKGVYLEDKDGTLVLLLGQFSDINLNTKSSVKVFIISCTDGQFYGTTLTPKSSVNEFAFLRVKSVDRNNAFLDWGLPNFFIPVPQLEQRIEMKTGFSYLVYVYLDEKVNCIKASSKITKFFDDKKADLRKDEKVNLLVYDKTEIGIKVVVENKYRGLIYSNELFKNLSYGDKMTGFVKAIRDDNKIDISMQKSGFDEVKSATKRILQRLENGDGFLPLTDKSPPNEIYEKMEMSKKTYKKAIGNLYKQGKIKFEKEGVRLVC